MSSLFYLLPFPGLQIAHGWEFWEQIIKKKKKKGHRRSNVVKVMDSNKVIYLVLVTPSNLQS